MAVRLFSKDISYKPYIKDLKPYLDLLCKNNMQLTLFSSHPFIRNQMENFWQSEHLLFLFKYLLEHYNKITLFICISAQ